MLRRAEVPEVTEYGCPAGGDVAWGYILEIPRAAAYGGGGGRGGEGGCMLLSPPAAAAPAEESTGMASN